MDTARRIRNLTNYALLENLKIILEEIFNLINLNNESIVKTEVNNEPTGSDQIFNIVSLTQAEYDAGTPNATTLYIITDA